MSYDISKITARNISELEDSDCKRSLQSDMVSGKCFMLIAPEFSNSGKGEMIIWLSD